MCWVSVYTEAAGILEMGLDVARGMSHLHDAGVIHQDLNPSNVLLTVEGRCKALRVSRCRGCVCVEGGIVVTCRWRFHVILDVVGEVVHMARWCCFVWWRGVLW